jgi:hypothetical protein
MQGPTLTLSRLPTYRQKKHTQYGVQLGNSWHFDKIPFKRSIISAGIKLNEAVYLSNCREARLTVGKTARHKQQ